MCEYNCAYALYKTNQPDSAASWVEAARHTASEEATFKHSAEINELNSAIAANVGFVLCTCVGVGVLSVFITSLCCCG